ncbi:MAG: 30S ribosome-binding factor RbfA [Verrucomicrobia bacterium]|nr:30S ribosome-binding factor RbfA [Verrucomicrobiota bacterium]
MSVRRLTRVNELLRREIGDVLFRVLGDAEIDLSAITVTRVETAPNLRKARVMISIRDDASRRDGILSILKRHRNDIQQAINRDLTLKYTPCLMFELDTSIERGDHVLSLLADIEADAAPRSDPPESEPNT